MKLLEISKINVLKNLILTKDTVFAFSDLLSNLDYFRSGAFDRIRFFPTSDKASVTDLCISVSGPN